MGLSTRFDVGAMNGAEVCLNVSLLIDDILEGNQTFEGEIAMTTPSVTVDIETDPVTCTTLITILDKDLGNVLL